MKQNPFISVLRGIGQTQMSHIQIRMGKFHGKIRESRYLHVRNEESICDKASWAFLEKVFKSNPKVQFSHIKSMEYTGAFGSWRTPWNAKPGNLKCNP